MRIFIVIALLIGVCVAAEGKKATYPLEASSRAKLIIDSARNERQRDFLEKAIPLAQAIQSRYGIPASATIAQAALESNYGSSDLAKNANNFFGIKSWNKKEARYYKKGCYYKVYDSMADSFRGYAEFLSKPRYNDVHKAKIGLDFIETALDCGYCPDPTYMGSVRTIVKRHKLGMLDRSGQPT